MRKVVLSHWISFDGFKVLDLGTEVRDYMAQLEDPEHDEYFVERLNSVGEHAMGSITYGHMSAHWPVRSDPIAEVMNRLPKLVFSRNPDVPTPWGPVRLFAGEAAESFAELKKEEGGDILVHGGNIFVQSLIEQDLIDEMRLNVLPVAIGAGFPLFPAGRLRKLRLLHSTAFPSGVQEVVFEPDRA